MKQLIGGECVQLYTNTHRENRSLGTAGGLEPPWSSVNCFALRPGREWTRERWGGGGGVEGVMEVGMG